MKSFVIRAKKPCAHVGMFTIKYKCCIFDENVNVNNEKKSKYS